MAKTVRVTSAQVNAAKLKIKRSAISGKIVPPSIHAVANAKRATNRDGDVYPTGTGQQISEP
jgi:hypothetical protein